eukprot:9485310-Pyramimonas_sp.AAC.1
MYAGVLGVQHGHGDRPVPHPGDGAHGGVASRVHRLWGYGDGAVGGGQGESSALRKMVYIRA